MDVFLLMPTLLSSLPTMLFSPRNTTVNFFPLFLLPSPYYGKNHSKLISHRFFPISLSYPKVQRGPGKGHKTLAHPTGALNFINPLFTITSASSALIFCVLDKAATRSVVQPNWLSSSNHWKPVCTEMSLKDQQEGSGKQGEDERVY